MFTTSNPDITLLLQGPLGPDRMDALDQMGYYRTLFGHIIVSTYSEHLSAYPGFRDWCAGLDIRVIEQSIHMPITRNDGRIYYHTATTLKGLQAVKTPYVMKHRLDERYSNLEQLIIKFQNNPNRMVCGTTVFGPKSYRLYHAADHLFIAATDTLLKSWSLTWDNLQLGRMEGSYGPSMMPDNQGAAEITYTKNFLRALGHDPTPEQHDQLMTDHIDFVNNKYLYPFVIRENGTHSVYRTIDDLGPSRNKFKTMQDMLTLSWDH
jgi:hypothetical protein